MAVKVWQKVKTQYCDRVGCEVSLEAEAIYPADPLPDQPPRLVAHRCSNAADCMLLPQANCVWSGANPLVDPFSGE
jgi:hypothetical protein